MCTMIAKQIEIEGSGKSMDGWFTLRQAAVSYDHTFHAPFVYGLNIDFTDQESGVGARVAVELSAEAARALVATIEAVLAQAEAEGHL
ncbi:MAG: hypothetical protein JW726_17240 [Anaerolineales bacterium]|nr:hypothetical protein [Anaerolineales bacterium]